MGVDITDIQIRPYMGVDSKKLEYGSGTIYAGVPSSLGFGVRGLSYSNFLASTASHHLSFLAYLTIPYSKGAKMKPQEYSRNRMGLHGLA